MHRKRNLLKKNTKESTTNKKCYKIITTVINVDLLGTGKTKNWSNECPISKLNILNLCISVILVLHKN